MKNESTQRGFESNLPGAIRETRQRNLSMSGMVYVMTPLAPLAILFSKGILSGSGMSRDEIFPLFFMFFRNIARLSWRGVPSGEARRRPGTCAFLWLVEGEWEKMSMEFSLPKLALARISASCFVIRCFNSGDASNSQNVRTSPLP